MNFTSSIVRFTAACLALTLAACGGGGGSNDGGGGGGTPPASTIVGPAGGTVNGPNGAKLVIPAGALATDTTIGIAQIAGSATPLPSGFSVSGPVFAFTPHGTTFSVPVTITLPFDPALVPAGTEPQFYKTNAQTQWEQVTNAAFGTDTVTAQVMSFSDAAIVIPPLVRGEPIREWSFSELRGDTLEVAEISAGIQVGGLLHELHDFGPTSHDIGIFFPDASLVLPPDGIATGQIASTADGVTFWVGAEAPRGNAGLPNDPIGSLSTLRQTQSFIKRAPNATLRFTLTTAFIDTTDLNGILARPCPELHTQGLVCDLIKGEIYLDVRAFTVPAAPNITPFDTFYHVAGGATLIGFAGSWDSSASTAAFSRTPLWTVEDFDFFIDDLNGHPEAHVLMTFRNPRTYTVDLSSIAVGQAFTLQAFTSAKTYNRAALSVSGKGSEFGSSASAFLRDPLGIGGTTVVFSGLEPIATPLPVVVPVDAPVAPAPCVPGPGPDPAAGVLQFGAAGFTVAESSSTPVVVVTRSGGSRGAVTVTITTSNGTAVAGTDYTPVNASVFFADGDTVPRTIAVPITQDVINAEPDKTLNLTLSQPGGCAALGAQSTAVLTIRDDDALPPPSLFTVGGTVNGLVGTRLVLENHRGLFLQMNADGPFTFSDIPTPSGQPYSVRVFNQPINPVQVCTVTNGSGVFANANVNNVVVNCV